MRAKQPSVPHADPEAWAWVAVGRGCAWWSTSPGDCSRCKDRQLSSHIPSGASIRMATSGQTGRLHEKIRQIYCRTHVLHASCCTTTQKGSPLHCWSFQLAPDGGSRRLRDVRRVKLDMFMQVLSHPQFKADPISAIAHHLSASLPPAPELPKPKADPLMRKQQKARRKFEKKLQKSAQGMEQDSD